MLVSNINELFRHFIISTFLHMSYKRTELVEFDMNHMLQPNLLIGIQGKRRSGKSILIKDIFNQCRDISLINVISLTEKMNPFYEYINNINAHINIHHKYSEDFLLKILLRQKVIGEQSLLVLDDALSSHTYDNVLQSIFD
jgi:hypothetical protein